MATKEIKTRIALRTGDYAYWTTGAGKDIELYKGEVCICTVATGDNQATNAPTVLFKVANANGQKFADLNWVSGLAADVYAWAKKANPDWTDFPALPLEVVDNGTGKFITDFTYANNKLTIARSDVAWDDVTGKPDFPNITITDDTEIEVPTTETVDVYKNLTANGHVLAEELVQVATKKAVDNALAAAKEYADNKPHENTAHTHSAGAGLAVDGNGGIEGTVTYSANIDVKYKDSKIQLIDKTTNVVIGEGFDASAFVKDSYLQSVAYDDETNILTFTFIDNEDNLEAIPVDLNDLVDVYTADEETLTKNNAAQFSIKDGGVTEAKLHADVTAKLNKEWDAKGAAATAEQNAKDYADGLVEGYGDIVTHNAAEFATSAENGAKALAQGVKDVVDANKATWDKAGTALQEITTTENNGLKVTNKNNIDIDTDVVFVLDCNW